MLRSTHTVVAIAAAVLLTAWFGVGLAYPHLLRPTCVRIASDDHPMAISCPKYRPAR